MSAQTATVTAKVVNDRDGQVILFPEGHRPFGCDEVIIERRGDEIVLRPMQRPDK